MIDSVLLRAPTSPPETGASTALQPLAAARAWISRASVGSVVVMSTNSVPAFAPARTPCSEKYTSRTSCGNPTIVKTTSDEAATAAGESAQAAPAAISCSAFARVRL